MYRKAGPDGYLASSENKYGYKSAPVRLSERKSDSLADRDHSSDLKHNDRNVFIKSRTFQNSNWRQPNALEKAPNHFENTQHTSSKKDIAVVNSFMPHFCSKKESNYTPTLAAVDNLTPKFLSMDVNSDYEIAPKIQLKTQNAASSSWNNQNSGHNSWRKPRNDSVRDSNHSSLSSYVRRKVYQGLELTASDVKALNQPAALHEILVSKRSLYEAMNELHGKTLKVQTEDFEREELSCEHVKKEMVSLYPHCNVTPYGIRLMGMAHPQTAIYMFFDSDGSSYFQATNENKELQTNIRKSVYNKMLNCGHCENVRNWDTQELITFIHSETQMSCVISFANGFKDQNTLLLKSYLKIDKRLKLLMLLVNDLVYRYHDISKHFTSYALNIMVIMFLQRIREPVLPSLHKIRTSFPYEKVIIGGFDCGFPKDYSFPSSSNPLSVETLLKEFCGFYKDFNFEDDVVSILGPEIKRSMFCPPYQISSTQHDTSTSVESLNSYLQSLRNGENVPKMNCDYPVIVQDPFELNGNAAEKVNCAVLTVFKMLCQDAYDILSTWC